MDSKGDHGEALPSLKSLMKLKKKYDAPDVMSLPEGYKSNTDKERLYLWSAENFKRQVRHKYPTLKPLCLTSKNECGTEKLTMTFLKVLYSTVFPVFYSKTVFSYRQPFCLILISSIWMKCPSLSVTFCITKLKNTRECYGLPPMFWQPRLATVWRSVIFWSAFFLDLVTELMLFADGLMKPPQKWIGLLINVHFYSKNLPRKIQILLIL